jgi:hypothetical protein
MSNYLSEIEENIFYRTVKYIFSLLLLHLRWTLLHHDWRNDGGHLGLHRRSWISTLLPRQVATLFPRITWTAVARGPIYLIEEPAPCVSTKTQCNLSLMHMTMYEVPCHPSPGIGTQEGPGCDLSSQEEVEEKEHKTQEVKTLKDGSGDTQMSPCWETIEEENEKDEEERSQEKENIGVADRMETSEPATILYKILQPSSISFNIDQGQKRQSQRIKEEGWEGVKVLDKATWAMQKKNLEGNHLNLKNSFAALDNDELVIRSKKMGIDTTNLDLENFDVLKDLEKARACLKDRVENLGDSDDKCRCGKWSRH